MAGLLQHAFRAIRKLDRSVNSLQRAGLGPGFDAFDVLTRTRSELLRSIGLKQPKVTSMLLKILGLSPGSIKVFHDAEEGFFTEARPSPGAPAVIKLISDETAIAILKGELTHELEEQLLIPDVDIDN